MKKKKLIAKIKAIISEYGRFSTADVEANSSPVINMLGKDTCQLAENFYIDRVTAVTYVHEIETAEDFFLYEDLKNDVLTEILELAKLHKEIELENL